MKIEWRKINLIIYFVISLSVSLYLGVFGYDYYKLSIEERFYNEKEILLKPSGIWGHSYGILGSLSMIVGVTIYMLRKRVKKFGRISVLKNWLEFHIFLCTFGPILVTYHTSFKFGGIVAISYWSMVIVVLSGVIGRFIYIQIPRNIQGNELSLKELENINNDYSHKLIDEYGIEYSIVRRIEDYIDNYTNYMIKAQFFNKLFTIIFNSHRKFLKDIKQTLNNNNVPSNIIKNVLKITKQKIILNRKISLLKSMQTLFKYWHVAHLPFAIIMFLIMIIHVIVAIVFGYKWIF